MYKRQVVIALLFSAVRLKSAADGSVAREPLGAEACISTDQVIDDQLGWLIDRGTVESGIDYFYDKSGVQPYLLLCDNMGGKGGTITDDEAESYLQKLYDKLYDDEAVSYTHLDVYKRQVITFISFCWPLMKCMALPVRHSRKSSCGHSLNGLNCSLKNRKMVIGSGILCSISQYR